MPTFTLSDLSDDASSKQIYSLSIWPKIIAVFIFLTGIFNILSAILLRPSPFLTFLIQIFADVVPIEIFNASKTITVITGILLIILAHGVWRCKHRAWSLSMGVTIISLVSQVIKRSPVIEIVSMIVILFLLFFFRHEFKVRSTPFKLMNQLKTSLLVIVLLFCYSFLGYFLLRKDFNHVVTPVALMGDYQNVVSGTGSDLLVARTRRAQWFEESLLTINVFSLILIFAGLFAPLIQSPIQTKEIAKKIADLQRIFGWTSVSYFSLLQDKKYFFNGEEQALAYAISNGTAVVLGEPFSPVHDYPHIIQRFCTTMMESGLSTVFYLMTPQHQRFFKQAGLTSLKIGEEALIYPEQFDIQSPELKKIRNSISHVEKSSVTFQWFRLDQVPYRILAEFEQLHAHWVKHNSLPRLTFSVDFYPLPKDPAGFLAVAINSQHKVDACLTFLPYQNNSCLALDAMLRSSDSPNGVVEVLIAKSILFFREQHIKQISLGLVALAQTKSDEITPKLLQKGQTILFRYFHQFYNYQSLFLFKDKFHPQWEPRYLAFTNNAELIKLAIAIIGVHTRRKVWSKIPF